MRSFFNFSVHLPDYVWTVTVRNLKSFSPAVCEGIYCSMKFTRHFQNSHLQCSVGPTHKIIIPFISFLLLFIYFLSPVLIKKSFISEEETETEKETNQQYDIKAQNQNDPQDVLPQLDCPHHDITAIYPWVCLIAFWQSESHYQWTTCDCTFYRWLHLSVQTDGGKKEKEG